MAQRDYLMQQLEEMGYFLAGLIRRVLKLKEEKSEDDISGAIHDSIQEKLSINIDEAIAIGDTDFLYLLKEQIKTEAHLEQMAELLMLAGNSIRPSLSPGRLNYLEKSLFLYTHLQKTSANFSLAREERILEIQQILRS